MMIESVIEDKKILYISAEDQCWDKETLNELREKHNIIFMTSGDACLPVMIINSDGHEPEIAIGSEDDGTISFSKRYGYFDPSFSSYWIDSFIADLQEAKRIIDKS